MAMRSFFKFSDIRASEWPELLELLNSDHVSLALNTSEVNSNVIQLFANS